MHTLTDAEKVFLRKDVFWLPCTKTLEECREVRVGDGVYMVEPRDFAAGGKSPREKQNVALIRLKAMKAQRQGSDCCDVVSDAENEEKVRRFVWFASDWLCHSVCDPDRYATLVLIYNGGESSETVAKFVQELCQRPAFAEVREVILMDACMEVSPLHVWEECRRALGGRPHRITLTRDYMQLAQCLYRSYTRIRTHQRTHVDDDGYVVIVSRAEEEQEQETADGILVACMNGCSLMEGGKSKDPGEAVTSPFGRRAHAIAYAVFISTCVRMEREQTYGISEEEDSEEGTRGGRMLKRWMINWASRRSPTITTQKGGRRSFLCRRVLWPYIVSLRAFDNDRCCKETNRALSITSDDEVTYELWWHGPKKRHGIIVAAACQSLEHAYACHVLRGKGCALTTDHHGEDIVPEQHAWEACFALGFGKQRHPATSAHPRKQYDFRYVLLTTAVAFTTAFCCRAMLAYISSQKK